MISKLVTVRHLSRKAVVYIRQSHPHSFRTLPASIVVGTATYERNRRWQPVVRWDDWPLGGGAGEPAAEGGGDMADGEVFRAATGQGLVVSTGILGDLVLPEGTFDPDRADEIRDLAAQAAVYATQARGPGTLRAYRSAWRQYYDPLVLRPFGSEPTQNIDGVLGAGTGTATRRLRSRDRD
jgi:hypothetical protein